VSVVRRSIAACVVVIAAVAFAACVAGIVGIWSAHRQVTDKIEDVSARLDDGLGRAAATTRRLRRSIETIRGDVTLIRDGPDGLDPAGEKYKIVTAYLRTVADRLDNLSDAAATVSFFLQSRQELPFRRSKRLSPERLARAADRAKQLAAVVEEVQARLADREKLFTGQLLAALVKKVEAILQRCEEMVAEWETDIEDGRDDLADGKTQVLRWLLIGAIGATVVCGWVGVSQLSLIAHGWKWWRGV
jgi:hypothetical protein